ncbi:TetR/AcrR family transcriptional regulator [Streptomyces sp. NPDC093109]|uniref:TetR/AcrR family transcriptional regulator n=1 Tax=Streptomyces sp. NPDC093109 TaxID=3154977 RepID=UPI00344C45CB
MAIHQRKEREQAERRKLIINTARELANSEGWGAVTTRRLADLIEYSQPVLYKHFKGKEDIVRTVALEGFDELATGLREARGRADSPEAGLWALGRAYTHFAAKNPTVYEAMFTMSVDLVFGQPDSPDSLVEAFDELRRAVEVVAAGRDVDTLSELVWCALHGMVTLNRSGRLRPSHEDERLSVFVEQFIVLPTDQDAD